MTEISYSATEVKNRFGKVLREAAQYGEPIIVERDGKPVAVIMSIEAYERTQTKTLQPAPQLDELFGMWADRADMDEDWLANGRSRWQSDWSNE
ncbi:MAG: type II toxin-antitoxin system Phd/YefM family antitoxin [Anaerolineae bacterium]|nr:type II toxin-antitoxin system Phd/YefM family antitoxin [Anaerolineae bacterium]